MMDDSSQRRGWIDRLAEDLGPEARDRLATARGGLEIWAPLNRRSAGSSRLAAEVGLDVALWLAEHFPGERLSAPNLGGATAAAAEERRAYILAHPTAPVGELARKTGLTTRRIRQIRAQGAPRRAEAPKEIPPLLRLMGAP